jgi:hypothetical protein
MNGSKISFNALSFFDNRLNLIHRNINSLQLVDRKQKNKLALAEISLTLLAKAGFCFYYHHCEWDLF